MYNIAGSIKRDPILRWNLPDRVFFACGACHILAWAFLERYPDRGFRTVWVRPVAGFTGNHIVAVRGDSPCAPWASGDGLAFDYHGCSDWPALLAHMAAKAGRLWPGWDCTLVDMPADVLMSEAKSLTYEGLHLREPGQFLHNALPRARAFLDRFPAPPGP